MEERIIEYRKKIDAIDERIAADLNERAQVSRLIREIKQKAKLPMVDSQREQEILTRLAMANRGPLSDEDLQNIFKNMLHRMKNSE